MYLTSPCLPPPVRLKQRCQFLRRLVRSLDQLFFVAIDRVRLNQVPFVVFPEQLDGMRRVFGQNAQRDQGVLRQPQAGVEGAAHQAIPIPVHQQMRVPPVSRSGEDLGVGEVAPRDFDGANNCVPIIQHHDQPFRLFGASRAPQVGAGRVAETGLVAEAADDIDLSGVLIPCMCGTRPTIWPMRTKPRTMTVGSGIASYSGAGSVPGCGIEKCGDSANSMKVNSLACGDAGVNRIDAMASRGGQSPPARYGSRLFLLPAMRWRRRGPRLDAAAVGR